MRQSLDPDATTSNRVLRLYQKLLLDGRKHYQSDLANYLCCSPQTVMRLIAEIEGVVGASLISGLDKRRRWYQIKSISRNRLGLEFEELRFLAVCRDLAEPYLPEQVKKRVDQSIFNFSMLMADQEFADREKAQKEQIFNNAKGWIDYTPYFGILEKLVKAMDDKLICIINYQAAARKHAREHKVAVSRIVGMNNALYVLGATVSDNMKSMAKLINLAVHRIRDVTLTDKKWQFKIPAANLDMFGLPWHKPRLFRIRITNEKAARYVSERIWSDKQKIWKEDDGALILEITSCSQPEVEAWVRSFGEGAELIFIEDK